MEAWKARLDRILRAVLTNHEAEGAQFRPQDERGPARDLQHLRARVHGQEGAVKAVDGPPLLPEGEQGLGKVGGGGLMSGVVGVLARVRRGPAGTMGGV